VKLVSEKGRPCVMENPWPRKTVQLIRNNKKGETLKGNTLNFPTKENEIIQLTAI
jgi:hypothetical protein